MAFRLQVQASRVRVRDAGLEVATVHSFTQDNPAAVAVAVVDTYTILDH